MGCDKIKINAINANLIFFENFFFTALLLLIVEGFCGAGDFDDPADLGRSSGLPISRSFSGSRGLSRIRLKNFSNPEGGGFFGSVGDGLEGSGGLEEGGDGDGEDDNILCSPAVTRWFKLTTRSTFD
jgi:hypothetical protein